MIVSTFRSLLFSLCRFSLSKIIMSISRPADIVSDIFPIPLILEVYLHIPIINDIVIIIINI